MQLFYNVFKKNQKHEIRNLKQITSFDTLRHNQTATKYARKYFILFKY